MEQVSYYITSRDRYCSSGYDELKLQHIQEWIMDGCSVFLQIFAWGIKLSIPIRIHSETKIAVLKAVSLKKAEGECFCHVK